MNIRHIAAALAFASVAAGCAITQTAQPVAASGIGAICIKLNPQVMMGDFPRVLASQIEARGIRTSTFSGDRPAACKHHLEYTANWRWDFAMYLVFADLRVYENELLVGQALYDAKAAGLNFSKFGSTAEKLGGLVEQLFPRR